MKVQVVFILAILLLGQNLLSSIIPSHITIGFIPVKEAQKQEKELQEFARILQEEMQIPLNIYVAKSYDSLVQAIYQKKVDFAFLTSMSYASMAKPESVKILMQKVWGTQAHYYSSIIVPSNSKIQNLNDLKGKKIAFVDKMSTSGYVLPKIALHKTKLNSKDYSTLLYGNHKSAVDALLNNQVDAVATFASDKDAKEGAWTHLYKKAKKMKSLWISQRIPSDPFAVRKDFYQSHPSISHQLMFVLRNMNQTLANKPLKSFLKVDALKPVTASTYKDMRKIANNFTEIR